MRFIRSITIVLTMALIVSCSNSSIPQKLDSFVDNAELKSGDYDAKDWQKSLAKYERLVEEYNNSDNEYTDSEKHMAAQAMGRYHSLLLKNGIKASALYLEELKSILPAYLEGLVEGINEDSEELGKTLEGLFDSEELEKTFENLGSQLEEIFGNLGAE